MYRSSIELKKLKELKELKKSVKEQMLGHYERLTFGVLIIAVLLYTLSLILYRIMSESLAWYLISDLAKSIVISVFATGYVKICMDISRNNGAVSRDYFYAIKHDPDKVVALSTVFWILKWIPRLAVMLTGMVSASKITLVVVYVIVKLICLYAILFLAFCYPIYVDNPDLTAIQIIIYSCTVTEAYRKKFLRLVVDFIPMLLLVVVTLGAGLFLIYPYGNMILVNFYDDVMKGDSNGYYSET